MPPTPDPRLSPWKELFRRGDLHQHMPLMGTLVEMADKLSSAAGYLRELDPDDPQQAALGVKIGTLAARYFGAVVDNLGLGDGEPVALPTNLFQARTLVDNVLLDVQGRIQAGWLANAEAGAVQDAENDARLESILANAGPAAPEPGQPTLSPPADHALAADADAGTNSGIPVGCRPRPEQARLAVDRKRFTFIWNGTNHAMGYGKQFLLLELLLSEPGRYFTPQELAKAVWDDEMPEPNTVQKTTSELRKTLRAAGVTNFAIKVQGSSYALILN